MASCTKVTGATSAVAQFYQRGQLDLSEYYHSSRKHFIFMLIYSFSLRYSNLEVFR